MAPVVIEKGQGFAIREGGQTVGKGNSNREVIK